jgi:hypothetical protein
VNITEWFSLKNIVHWKGEIRLPLPFFYSVMLFLLFFNLKELFKKLSFYRYMDQLQTHLFGLLVGNDIGGLLREFHT